MSDIVTINDAQARLNRVIQALIWFIAVGAAGYLSAVIWVGWENVAQAFIAIGWLNFTFAIITCGSSYAWRYARWEHILSFFGYHLPRKSHVAIYLAGLALTATPGKSGETFRSALLLPFDVKVHKSLAAFVTDRATDVLGIVLLGGVAAWFAGVPGYWLWFSGLLAMLIISQIISWTILSRSGKAFLAKLVSYFNFGSVSFSVAVGEAWATVWKLKRVLPYSIVALIAYASQALVFAWLCSQVTNAITVSQAILMFVQASLFGAASMMPGGIGAMEASLIYQLVEQGVELSHAISLAVLIRAATLWSSIAVGVVALVCASRSVGVVELGQK